MNALRSSNRKELPAEIVYYDGWMLLLTREISMLMQTHLGCITCHKNAMRVFAQAMQYYKYLEHDPRNSCWAHTFDINEQVILGLTLIQRVCISCEPPVVNGCLPHQHIWIMSGMWINQEINALNKDTCRQSNFGPGTFPSIALISAWVLNKNTWVWSIPGPKQMSPTAQQRHTHRDFVCACDKSRTNRRYGPAVMQKMTFGGSNLYMLPDSMRRSWIPVRARTPVR
jgi:hypothetical protein